VSEGIEGHVVGQLFFHVVLVGVEAGGGNGGRLGWVSGAGFY